MLILGAYMGPVAMELPPDGPVYQLTIVPFAPTLALSVTIPAPHRLELVPAGTDGITLTVATTGTRATVLSQTDVVLKLLM